MHDLLTISILYSIQQFNDYEPLIKAVEDGNLIVMENETTHKLIVGLLRGKKLGVGLDGKRTGRNRDIVERDKKLVEIFNAYVTFGFPQYSSYDEDRIDNEEEPQTAVAKLYYFYNEKIVKENSFLERLAYGSILDIVKKSNKTSPKKTKPLGLDVSAMWLCIYDREKKNIDMSKLKENVKGTWCDFDTFHDMWEIVDPDFFGGK